MIEWFVIGVTFSLIGYMFFLQIQFGKERRDLMDRLMAKTFQEFKEKTVPVNLGKMDTPTPNEYIPLDSLTDDEFEKAMKVQAGRESTLEKTARRIKSTIKV